MKTQDPDLARLDRRIKQFNRAVDDVVDTANMLYERVPSLRPKAREMIALADREVAKLAPGHGVREVFVAGPAGVERRVVRY